MHESIKWIAENNSMGKVLCLKAIQNSKRQHLKFLQITSHLLFWVTFELKQKLLSVHTYEMMLLATFRHNQNVNLEINTD